MLLTICPNCAAQFKVQPEQLNVRQGRVMCGRCRQVFNAFQSLSRVEETIDLHVDRAQDPLPESTQRAPESDAPSPLLTIDSVALPVADPIFLREEPSPLPAAFSALGPLSPAPVAVAPVQSGFAASEVKIPPLHQSHVEEIAPFHDQGDDLALVAPGIDLTVEGNPLLVDTQVNSGTLIEEPSRAWRFGVFLLFVCLLAQAAYTFRTNIVSSYPQLRPSFGQLCELVGCSISWGRDEAAFEIVASELIEAPGKPGRILLTAILVNRGKTKQDMPSLELRLTDNANQVVVSRVLHPVDYLGRAMSKDEGLVPNTDLYVNLNLEIGNRPLASGYGLRPFYP